MPHASRAIVLLVASLFLVVLLLPGVCEALPAKGIAVGGGHSCALTTARGVKCWGHNDSGQLGDGTSADSNAPVSVTGLSGGVTSVTAGLGHSCAVTTDGAVLCWGENLNGQLGDGTTTDRWTPAPVSGLTAGIVQVAASVVHTCALTAGGAVKCWGNNANGQLGNGTGANSTTPVDVSGLGGGAVALGAGGYHTCAVMMAGGLRCWGYNANGQLGDGTTTTRTTPVPVALASVAAAAAGTYHTCALTLAGGLQCWGKNDRGQLGDGTTTDRHTPTAAYGLTAGVSSAQLGDMHTCAVLSTGVLQCWGENGNGQLGDGTTTDRWTPVSVSLMGGTGAVSAGGSHTCGLMPGGTA